MSGEVRMADCLFCRLVAGEIVRRTADAVAFHDINPQAPVHVLVIPTQHVAAVRSATGSDGERVLGRTLAFAAETARELGLDAGGYRIVTNTGASAGQTVDHLHFHVLGGRRLGWPPG
jgi:histidine triad (HIT) family protein